MKVISGGVNKKLDLQANLNEVEKVSFSPNELVYIGTYSLVNGTFEPSAPFQKDDFIFDVDEKGNCLVMTDETLIYDEETGALYLFKED